MFMNWELGNRQAKLEKENTQQKNNPGNFSAPPELFLCIFLRFFSEEITPRVYQNLSWGDV